MSIFRRRAQTPSRLLPLLEAAHQAREKQLQRHYKDALRHVGAILGERPRAEALHPVSDDEIRFTIDDLDFTVKYEYCEGYPYGDFIWRLYYNGQPFSDLSQLADLLDEEASA